MQTLTAAMLPSEAPQAAGSKQPANPWMRVGAVAAAATFSDSFTATSLDSRWTRSDGRAHASLDGKGLTLAPGASGVAALMQAAAPGDVTLAVQVNRPGILSDKANVGLALYQDDGDWLTVAVDRTGTVQLCAMLRQAAQPCAVSKVKANPNATIWLRVQRSGSAFTAEWSGDGATWQQVGQWTPDMSAAPPQALSSGTMTPATATTIATSTPDRDPTAAAGAATPSDPAAAPLAFTSWGVISTGNGSTGSWPHISAFTVTPAPVPMPPTPGLTPALVP